jgi:hypothetical protein
LLGTNQACVVTGVVEEHVGKVTLTVMQLRLLLASEWEDPDAPLEHSIE